MESQPSLQLAELLASRFCHDLIAPIGAINTGLELLQETLPGHLSESDEVLHLILNSAETASARISFYRAAFGSGGGNIPLDTLQDLVKKYFLRSKLQIKWKDSPQKELPLHPWGRLLLNAVLWMSECAPRGGILHISAPREDQPLLSLCLKAESIILHQGTVEALEGKAELLNVTPRTIPCYLIYTLVQMEKGTLTVHKTSTPSELLLEVRMA
jgi:histidine phosphotransferase ChpT